MYLRIIVVLALFIVAAGPASLRADFPVPDPTYNNSPSFYNAVFTETPIVIDGLNDDEAWKRADWSEPFVDIRGRHFEPKPRHVTRVHMAWDSTYFYIYAWMDEPHLWATYDQHDMVIYHENDFEVFIDPDGDNHNYFELEINALGTTWDLLLTRPYRDGGHAVDSWEIPGLKKAVHLEGTLNDPSDIDKGWVVELAMPWKVLEECASHSGPPKEGEQWHVNFSRVQWQLDVEDGQYVKRTDPETGKSIPEDNWVWSPQGLIAMHYPEMWGIVTFSKTHLGIQNPLRVYSELSTNGKMMGIYYAQRQFRDSTGKWASSFEELGIELWKLFGKGNEYPWIVSTPVGFQVILERELISESDTQYQYTVVDQTGRIWTESYKEAQ